MHSQSILVVDGGMLFRDGLARMLTGTCFAVQAEATTTTALQHRGALAPPPDLILLDCSGAADQMGPSLSALRNCFPKARVVLLSTLVTRSSLCRAFGAGASGYLLKDISCEALVECLMLVAMGEKVFPTRLAEMLADGEAPAAGPAPPAPEADGQPLSRREWQILGCLVGGDSNKLIAKKLAITEATVKVHLKGALRKINARNRTQAAIWALSRRDPHAPNGDAAEDPDPLAEPVPAEFVHLA